HTLVSPRSRLSVRRPPRPTLFPYTTLFRSMKSAMPQHRQEILHPRRSWILIVILGMFLLSKSALLAADVEVTASLTQAATEVGQDRKSTRLNSSHLVISYAVFCLKKKSKKE